MFEYNMQSIFESVSVLLQRTSLTTISLWFSFTLKLPIGHGKVFDYFWEEMTITILIEIAPGTPTPLNPFISISF